MTTAGAFSQIEWDLITELPRRIIAAMASVEQDTGTELTMELVAGLTELAIGAELRAEFRLVQDVLAAAQASAGDPERDFLTSQLAIDHLSTDTLHRAGQVAAIMRLKVAPEEQEAYRSWLLYTAEAVSLAAKTGGRLPVIGGKRVTNAEAVFLKQLEQRLS